MQDRTDYVDELLAVWSRDRLEEHKARVRVRQAWPELAQRLDDLLDEWGGDVMSDAPRPDLDEAERPNFEGHEGRECGEHRTVGPHRAWCHDCSEWCYPEGPCANCELPVLRKLLDERDAEIARLRAAVDGLLRACDEADADLVRSAAAQGQPPTREDGGPRYASFFTVEIRRALATAPAPAEDEARPVQGSTGAPIECRDVTVTGAVHPAVPAPAEDPNAWIGWRCTKCGHEMRRPEPRFCPRCAYTVYAPIKAHERPEWAAPAPAREQADPPCSCDYLGGLCDRHLDEDRV